ncbi:MAG: hypothetical protein V2I36_03010 [Desulfopila sp.]|nr:hypothetical protein [Desulfopila sp.]
MRRFILSPLFECVERFALTAIVAYRGKTRDLSPSDRQDPFLCRCHHAARSSIAKKEQARPIEKKKSFHNFSFVVEKVIAKKIPEPEQPQWRRFWFGDTVFFHE